MLEVITPFQHGLWNSPGALCNIKAKTMLELLSGLIPAWLNLNKNTRVYPKIAILGYSFHYFYESIKILHIYIFKEIVVDK